MHRRLAAILAADVAGYFRLMGRDESGRSPGIVRNRSGDATTPLGHLERALPGWCSLAASAAAIGKPDEARTAMERLLTLEPGYSIQRFVARYSMANPERFAPMVADLRRAGLPDRAFCLGDHVPVHLGARLPRKASMPSRKSALP